MNKLIRKLYNKLRFGAVYFITKEAINGHIAEYEVRRKKDNKLVGYFAYGYYDPSLPYKDKEQQ